MDSADLVYSEEMVDKKLIGAKRVINGSTAVWSVGF